ncbi:MAG: extracellular solute-binding protein [Acetivibrio ethanolgignens]
MKKINGKRLGALVMAGIMSASLLTGCGGGNGGSKQTSTAEFDKNLIYKATYYNKPEELSYLGNVAAGMDGKIYIQSFSEKVGKDVTAQMNPDTGKVERIISNEDSMENTWTMSFTIDKDGNFWKIVGSWKMDEKNPENSKNIYYIVETDPTGKELLKNQLEVKDENFYSSAMLFDNAGNLVIAFSNAIAVYDAKGKELFTIDTPTYVESMVKDGKGNICTVAHNDDYTQRIISRLDTQSKQLSEVRKLAAGLNMMNLISGPDGLYMNDGVYVYSYDIESDEKTKILNWINSDINGSSTYDISCLPDGRFVGNVYDELTQENQIMVVEKVAPEDVKDKKLVTLAMPYNDYNVNIAVISFNKKNDEYRIIIDDYSKYATAEDFSAGADKMNTDLISGKVPDLVSVGNLPIGNYTSKGLFADLYEQMDKDSEFNRSDYMENIFKAFEKDGKLYSIAPGYSVLTVIAKEENVGKTPGWTMEDLEKLMAQKPEGTKIFEGETQTSVLQRGLFLAINQYIDYAKGTCNFDTEAFVKQFPKEVDNGMEGVIAVEEANAMEEATKYATDKVMLQTYFLYNYGQLHNDKYYSYGGKELTFIVLPTENNQFSYITSNMEIAMSAKAAYPEGAWAFIKYLLGDEYQGSRSYEWPIKKSVYADLKTKAQKPDTYTDENGKEQVYENTAVINGKEVKIGKVTDEEVAKIDEFLASLTQVMRYDTKVEEIITEETGAYFSDQKSAEEVAKLIQNRVQTYLSESQ